MGLRWGLVRWQEEESGSGGSDKFVHHRAFMRAEIVENDDIARLQGFDELDFDVGRKPRR